jgi:hypothetical protein
VFGSFLEISRYLWVKQQKNYIFGPTNRFHFLGGGERSEDSVPWLSYAQKIKIEYMFEHEHL